MWISRIEIGGQSDVGFTERLWRLSDKTDHLGTKDYDPVDHVGSSWQARVATRYFPR